MYIIRLGSKSTGTIYTIVLVIASRKLITWPLRMTFSMPSHSSSCPNAAFAMTASVRRFMSDWVEDELFWCHEVMRRCVWSLVSLHTRSLAPEPSANGGATIRR